MPQNTYDMSRPSGAASAVRPRRHESRIVASAAVGSEKPRGDGGSDVAVGHHVVDGGLGRGVGEGSATDRERATMASGDVDGAAAVTSRPRRRVWLNVDVHRHLVILDDVGARPFRNVKLVEEALRSDHSASSTPGRRPKRRQLVIGCRTEEVSHPHVVVEGRHADSCHTMDPVAASSVT